MRKSVSLGDEMAAQIKKVAAIRYISQSDVIREAIGEYLTKRGYTKHGVKG